MSETSSIELVDEGDDYYHVRYNDPDQFDEIRTPDWAEEPAGSVVEGSEVRTGDTKGDEDWTIQSVLIPIDAAADENEAKDLAQQIVEKIES